MKQDVRTHRRSTSVMLIGALLLLSSCGAASGSQADAPDEPSLAVLTSDIYHATSLQELGSHADLVVAGEIVGEKRGRTAGREPGDPYSGLTFLNLAIRVDQVLSGPGEPGKEVLVEVLGWQGDQAVTILNGVRRPQTGAEGVFFLMASADVDGGWVPVNSQAMLIPGYVVGERSAGLRAPNGASDISAPVLELIPDLNELAVSDLVEHVQVQLKNAGR